LQGQSGGRLSGAGIAAALVFTVLVLAAGLPPALSHGSPSVSTVAGRDCLACHVSLTATPSGVSAGPLRGVPSAGLQALIYAVAAVSLALAWIGLARIVETVRRGPGYPGRVAASLRGLLVDALLQARLLRSSRQDALIHTPIYLGGALLLAAGLLYMAAPSAALSPYAGHPTVYTVFRVAVNAGAALLLLGVTWAAERRILALRPPMETVLDDAATLALLAAAAVTGMVVDAATAVAHARVGWLDPASVLLQGLWGGVAAEAFPAAYTAALLAHVASIAGLVVSLGWGRLRHLALAPASLALRRQEAPPAAAPPVPDAERLVDERGYLGAQKASDINWRMRLDYEACTRCALCTSLCPAYASGRPLSPMHLVQAMRRAVEDEEEQLVPVVVKPETLWSCTTCGACLHACPVGVHHVETVTELRRGLVSSGEHVPEELLQVSYSLMRTGNPYGSDPYEREQWLQQLADQGLLEIAEPGQEYDLLLWVGCANAYDPRLRGVVESLLRLLKRAGLRVAAAPGQQCCGEPARRIGDELMFQELVRMNTEELSQYRFKQILVTCPHGLHVLRHEYPQYGAPRWNVIHHTQLLAELIKQGKLKPAKKLDKTVTYHDPCYLARWNNTTEEPRQVIQAATTTLKEMRRSRRNTFCCGGGGGGVFYDPKIGKRPARIRIEEAKATGAEILAVACPFCNIMLSAEAPDYNIEVKDIAQLLDEAAHGGRETGSRE